MYHYHTPTTTTTHVGDVRVSDIDKCSGKPVYINNGEFSLNPDKKSLLAGYVVSSDDLIDPDKNPNITFSFHTNITLPTDLNPETIIMNLVNVQMARQIMILLVAFGMSPL